MVRYRLSYVFYLASSHAGAAAPGQSSNRTLYVLLGTAVVGIQRQKAVQHCNYNYKHMYTRCLFALGMKETISKGENTYAGKYKQLNPVLSQGI